MTRSRRATLAMLLIGLAIFSGLYSTQAILPVLVEETDMSSGAAALTVSAATGGLALFVIPASILSERFGRGRVLLASVIGAALIGMLVPFATTGWAVIALRGLQGAVMSGAPATAMAWLAEELEPRALARAMGIYIAGNSIGGLIGRLVPTFATEVFTWRGALWTGAAVTLAFALVAAFLLPPQQRFTPKEIHLRSELSALFQHWRDGHLAALYAVAFLAMGTFVSLYNFIGFRLIEHFGIPPVIAGFVFLLYLSGTWSSTRASGFINRFGRRATLTGSSALMVVGSLLAAGPLPVLFVGLLLFTAGFFAAHSTASGWVGVRATHDRAEASSMYVFCYYLGSSILGAATGWAFSVIPWGAYAVVLAVLSLLPTLIAANLSD